MPEYLRTLIVILVLAVGVFTFARRPACAVACTKEDFDRRRNLWFAMTLTAFLAHNFWVFIVVAAVILAFAAIREPNKLALFYLLLFAVPAISEQIPGFGLIKYFFTIHYIRLLTLTLLLPAYLSLRAQPGTVPFGRTIADKLLIAYLVLQFVLQAKEDTLTNSLRHGVFYAFVDVFLPYYVASRLLKDLGSFKDALMGFVVAVLVLSPIAVFENLRHWLLYNPLSDALGVYWELGIYLERGDGGALRAQGSTGQPIPLGYVMAVAVGFALFLRKSIPDYKSWVYAVVALLAGLVAPLSRGPWVGAAAMFLSFVATGPAPGKTFAKLALASVILIPVLLISPAGDSIIQHLPFIGSVENENVTYRARLLEMCVQLILQNPLFGAPDYVYTFALEELRQGQGIIDIVNTYLGIGMSSGLVGLSLFVGFFAVIGLGIAKAMIKLPDKDDERHLLGRVLLSVLAGILVIIFTTSSISVIPVIYWSVAGLGAAYIRVMAQPAADEAAPAGIPPAPLKFRT